MDDRRSTGPADGNTAAAAAEPSYFRPSVAAAAGLPTLDTLRGPDAPLAELADLPGTLTMLEDVGLL